MGRGFFLSSLAAQCGQRLRPAPQISEKAWWGEVIVIVN